MDLLEAAGERALPCIPQLIVPLKFALDTRDPQVRCGMALTARRSSQLEHRHFLCKQQAAVFIGRAKNLRGTVACM